MGFTKSIEFDHGSAFFQTLSAMVNWAQREHYPVDEALLRLRVPKVPEKEMEAYSPDELAARPGFLKVAQVGPWMRRGGAALARPRSIARMREQRLSFTSPLHPK